MKIEAGQTLLHYRLSEKIGEGGMGQVWGAVDTTLDRRVAIKILPDAFADDADRLARFEREAKLLASLSHPNIAVLHGLHQTPSTSSGQAGVHFLSMELVEGLDLAERLQRGALPVDEALQTCLQIAQALEAAHERGIIHRDLKPANIKLEPGGTVKVLDFGLAKALGPEASNPDVDPSRSPTLTMASTQAGVILGTAGYMSPEQVRGKPADRRADIWAFGVVLYELLTGVKTFGGDTASDSMAKILEREPNWDAMPRTVPAEIRRLLRRCLAKEVSRRLQAIGDARIAIEECLDDPNALLDEAPTPASPAWRRLLPYALVPLALLAGWIFRPTESPDPAPTLKFELPLPEGLRLNHYHRNGLALSPDGRTLAFTAGDQIYLRTLDEWSERLLTDIEGIMPRFSPSGQWLAFVSHDGVSRIPIAGGEVKLVHESEPQGGMTWATDEFIVFAPEMVGGLMRVPTSGGDPEPITELDEDADEVSHRLPHALPGGKTLLFTAIRYRTVPISGGDPKIFALDLATGERKLLIDNAFDARYVPTGHIVFAREGRLFAAPFDLERTEVTGPEVLVLDGVTHSVDTGLDTNDSGAAQFSISDSGVLAYTSGSVYPGLKRPLLWIDRQGNAEPLEDGPEGDWYSVRVSPDGHKALLTSRDVWIYDLQRKIMRRQTFEADHFYAIWGPGPDRFTTDSDREGSAGIYTKVINSGPGELEKLETPAGDYLLPGSWSPDGKRLVFYRATDGFAISQQFVFSRDDGVAEFQPSKLKVAHPQFSPDGRWIAYVMAVSDREEVFISRYPEVGAPIQISNRGGSAPTWSSDGSEVFYRWDGKMFAVRVELGNDNPSPSEPVKLMDLNYRGCGPVRCYDIAPDGRFLVIGQLDDEESLAASEAFFPDRVRIVQNWFTELTEKVPVAP